MIYTKFLPASVQDFMVFFESEAISFDLMFCINLTLPMGLVFANDPYILLKFDKKWYNCGVD